jgi:hypothetical protein
MRLNAHRYLHALHALHTPIILYEPTSSTHMRIALQAHRTLAWQALVLAASNTPPEPPPPIPPPPKLPSALYRRGGRCRGGGEGRYGSQKGRPETVAPACACLGELKSKELSVGVKAQNAALTDRGTRRSERATSGDGLHNTQAQVYPRGLREGSSEPAARCLSSHRGTPAQPRAAFYK